MVSFVKDIFIFEKKEKIKLTKQEKRSDIKFFCLAFFIPFAVMLAAAVATDLAPFGDKTLMAIDAWGQYFPMLREMKRAFRSLDFSYSFTGALGFDMTAQSAYYTNSPLWYLLFLLPGELTPAQVDMAVFIRFGLASLAFSYYLSEHFGKKTNSMLLFASAYAFSGYTLAFINQFMWMDAVVLLPLVLLGIERLYKGKGMLLYTGALFLTIYSNFYIAFSVCIFSVLWFFLLTFSEKVSVRDWFIRAFRFGITSLLTGVLNLGVLLPLIKAIGNTLASGMGFTGELKFYHSLFEMVSMLFPYTKSSLAYEAPNIYFGLFCFLLCIVALFAKIPVRKKLCFAGLFAFMFVSFNFNLLDYIWHGFHFPNQLPGRQSFLFIFLGLVIAFCGFQTLQELLQNRRNIVRAVSVILCILIGFEIYSNAVIKLAANTPKVSESSVLRNAEALSEVRENCTPDKDKNEFWRIETVPHRYNGGQLHGYYGISHYSSTMSGDCYNFFTKLGMSVYAKNVSIQYLPNPVLNSLFGIRYIANTENKGDEVSEYYGTAENMFVYENTQVLPLFYVVNSDVLSLDESLKGHAYTNEIFKKAAGTGDVIKGTGVIKENKSEEYILNEAEFIKGIDNILQSKTEITHFGKTKIKGTVEASHDGVLMISLPAKDVTLEIDGEKVETLTIAGYMAGAEISEGTHEITIKLL